MALAYVANLSDETGTLQLPVPSGTPLGNVRGLGASVGNPLDLWGVALEWSVPLGIALGSGALELPLPLEPPWAMSMW